MKFARRLYVGIQASLGTIPARKAHANVSGEPDSPVIRSISSISLSLGGRSDRIGYSKGADA